MNTSLLIQNNAFGKKQKGLIFFLLIVLTISFSQNGCRNPETSMKGDITILQSINGEEQNASLESHKEWDVVVSRASFMKVNDVYSVRYYHKEHDNLVSHKAWVEADEEFDKASYNWLNDTIVSIRLFNTLSGKEKTVKLFGHGRTSGILTGE